MVSKLNIFSKKAELLVHIHKQACQLFTITKITHYCREVCQEVLWLKCFFFGFEIFPNHFNSYFPLSQIHYHRENTNKNKTGLKIFKPKKNLSHNRDPAVCCLVSELDLKSEGRWFERCLRKKQDGRGFIPCDGVESHPGGVALLLSCFMLRNRIKGPLYYLVAK